MKHQNKFRLLFLSLLLAASASMVKAQSSDGVVMNPDASADIKLVSDYINDLISGNSDKAKAALAPSFKGYGPSPADSSTADQTINEWKENYKNQSDRKVSFETASFRVTEGDFMGDWVSVWGDYSFTANGKNVKFPFQYTAHVTNAKIDGSRIYYDNAYILTSLGYKLTPPTGSK